MIESWHITITVPAESRFLHVVRLTAAGAAAESELSTEQIEDVKIAIDELAAAAISAAGITAELVIDFRGDDTGLEVRCSVEVDSPLVIDELSTAILDATVDEYAVTAGVQSQAGFTLTKRRER